MNRSAIALSLVLVLTTVPASAQYSWDAHFGPQQTGFERTWFGNWEIEILPVRGMIDRSVYESDRLASRGVRKINRTVTRHDRAGMGSRVVHKSVSLVNSDGRVTATVYKNPQTGKQVQRESFKYDDSGRLLEWRPVRDPQEVPIASIAATAYAGHRPYGRYQMFRYYPDGTLMEWRACTPGRDRQSQACEDAYIKFDSAGRIIEFIWLEDVFRIQRDGDGNIESVESAHRGREKGFEMTIRYDDFVVRERYMNADSSVVENIVARDSQGRVVQYQIASLDTPGYYSTVTWDYADHGQLASIVRGLDSYVFAYDKAGRLTAVDQTVLPRTIRREYDERGRLSLQSPPLAYNRFDLLEEGSEVHRYDEAGLLLSISVVTTDGTELGVVDFDYEYYASASSRP
jgi:hypothetical protein